MIIDTEKLVEFINKRDDITHPNINWDKCSMAFLNLCEKRAVESIKAVEQIEELANEMKPLLKQEQNTQQGFIILNEDGKLGWDDKTEFHPDKETAQDRVNEITENDETVKLKVIPATLVY